jgi:hypothetical protein
VKLKLCEKHKEFQEEVRTALEGLVKEGLVNKGGEGEYSVNTEDLRGKVLCSLIEMTLRSERQVAH